MVGHELRCGPVYGTGSSPPLLHGLQRRIRQVPSAMPRRTPYFWIACAVYSEQVGAYLHVGGRNLALRCQSRIRPMHSRRNAAPPQASRPPSVETHPTWLQGVCKQPFRATTAPSVESLRRPHRGAAASQQTRSPCQGGTRPTMLYRIHADDVSRDCGRRRCRPSCQPRSRYARRLSRSFSCRGAGTSTHIGGPGCRPLGNPGLVEDDSRCQAPRHLSSTMPLCPPSCRGRRSMQELERVEPRPSGGVAPSGDAPSAHCGHPWWPFVSGIHEPACAVGSWVDKSASLFRTPQYQCAVIIAQREVGADVALTLRSRRGYNALS